MDNLESDIPVDGIQSPPVDLSRPINLSNLQGLTILITGGASGLGAGFARHWATHGANLIIGDLNHTLGESLIADLRTSTSNPNHHFLPLDVTSWSSQLSFFEEAIKLSPHGGIDCVVASAGVSLSDQTLFFEKPPNYHDHLAQGKPPPPAPPLKILDVNLTGVLYTVHLAHAYLPLNPGSQKCNPHQPSPSPSSNRDRHILLISSIAGLLPLPTQSLYSVSKHGVTGLFRSLRVTSPIRHGIRVNMLCPYYTATPILGLAGNALLAGAAPAEVESVVEAATRLVADKMVVGRGLGVGPRAARGDVVSVGGGGEGVVAEKGDVWEVYAHDFEQSDVTSRRLLALTNLIAGRKGWVDLVRELVVVVRRHLGW